MKERSSAQLHSEPDAEASRFFFLQLVERREAQSMAMNTVHVWTLLTSCSLQKAAPRACCSTWFLVLDSLASQVGTAPLAAATFQSWSW